MRTPPPRGISAAVQSQIEDLLGGPDAETARHFPGSHLRRQPVHTVYVAGHLYRPELPGEWGDQAQEAVAGAGGIGHLLSVHGLAAPDEHEALGRQVMAKLASEPIEDLRIDFEDGYGQPGDETEDDAVRGAAQSVARAGATGVLPPFVGIRFKCLEPATRQRGLRTLELFLTTLVESGGLPPRLRLTLPKVTTVEQVEAMVLACQELERSLGLAADRLSFEIQVETPQAITSPEGVAQIAPMIHAGQGRVSGLHYGTYDYSASLGIAAADQSMEHPAADYAKAVMQVAAAGTGVELSDGSTNVMPVGEAVNVDAAWALHGRLVNRSLHRGYYQGWDLHPAQLPSRFAATYSFFRATLGESRTRLRAYLGHEEAIAVLDEPATAKAMAAFLLRGLDCGAIEETELGGLEASVLREVARSGRGTPDA